MSGKLAGCISRMTSWGIDGVWIFEAHLSSGLFSKSAEFGCIV